MQDSIWDRLGIPETGDLREIRRAYARRLKERRPDEDAESFQLLREAYETALQLAAWADVEEQTDETELPETAEEKSPLAASLEAAWASGSEQGAAALLGELLAEDRGLAGSDELEREVARWLCRFERPPARLIEMADARFGWRSGEERQQMLPEARYLTSRLLGYHQMEEMLARLKFEPHPVLQAVADWLRGELDAEVTARRLRRSGLDTSALQLAIHHHWAAFHFEIDPRLVEWIEAQLPLPKPRGPIARFLQRALAYNFELPKGLGRWRFTYATFLLCAAPAMLLARVQVQPRHYYLLALAPFLPLLLEFARAEVRRRKIVLFDGLPTAALWSVLLFAVAAQIDFRSRDYEIWWAATVLAILLAYEDDPPPDLWIAAHLFGFMAFYFGAVHQVEAPEASPFAAFFLPLIRFPGSFFGRLAPGEDWSRIILAILFAAATLAGASLPAGGDTRRITLGVALIFLVLLLRAYRFRLGDLIVLPLLVALAANLLETTLAATPALLLLFLPGIPLWKALDPFLAPIAQLSSQTRIGR